jgi:hypothetical protein
VKLPDWTYWEPIDTPIVGNAVAPDLPLKEADVVRPGGAEARWAGAPAALKDSVTKQAFGVVRGQIPRTRLGAFYTDLQKAEVPFVITLDALFFLSHLALDRAMVEVEDRQLAPALGTLVTRLEMRLVDESRDARADLAPAYLVARGLVAVASALSNATYVAPPELVDVVAKEKALVLAHAGPATSPLLGVTIDYSSMTARGFADRDPIRFGYFRAMTWLAQAPLILAGSGEEGAAGKVSVALARTHARAALMISRLVDYDVDVEAAQAWERIEHLSKFIAGKSDDVTPQDLVKEAIANGTDLKDPKWIANVTRVDRLRHIATKKHVTRLYDGGGGVRVVRTPARVPTAVRGAPSMRLIGGRDEPDAEVLQGLVFPLVGALVPRPQGGAPVTARDGERALPTGLDIAAWLGSTEARTVLRETGDDAYQGYDDALDRLYKRRPPADAVARHSSLYVSALDAFATYVAPSAADGEQPGAIASAWRRRKIEVTLGAWTELRHDSMSFTRLPLAAVTTAPPPHEQQSTVPNFVEPHPEAIAKILALVRQTTKGLTALGALPNESPVRALLADIDDILWVALGAALHQANDEPLTDAQAAALAALPARLADVDARVSATGAADVPLAVDVHTDLGPARALEEATGPLDDLYLVVPEPRTRRLVLAIGARIPHYEVLEPAAQRLTDTVWRARVQAGGLPPAQAFVNGYVVGRTHTAMDTALAAKR